MLRCTLVLAAAFAAVAPPSATAAGSWSWPVGGTVLTPFRTGSNPYAGGQHRGVDIAAAEGTPVVAAAGGAVRFAGRAGSSGLTVSVRTADGRYDTSYLHLSAIAVREGAPVAAGDRLGAAGTTGRPFAPQPHLHFGVRDAGTRRYRDPLGLLAPPGAPPAAAPRVPAPVPVPMRPRPMAPVGVRAPGRAPRRVRVPVPRTAPVPRAAPLARRVRVPRPAPVRSPGAGPLGVASRQPAPADPAAAPARRPFALGYPPRALRAGSAASAPGEASGPAGSVSPQPGPGVARRGGIGLAWGAAVLGLLAAAAGLGARRGGGGAGTGAAAATAARVRAGIAALGVALARR